MSLLVEDSWFEVVNDYVCLENIGAQVVIVVKLTLQGSPGNLWK